MDDKPLVFAVDNFKQMIPFYEKAAESVGASFMAGSSIDNLPLPDVRLMFVDGHHLEDVARARMRGFNGGAVLVSGGCPSSHEYRDLGVNEAWGRPLCFASLEQAEILRALMRKYTSSPARVLCVDDNAGYLELMLLFVKRAGFTPVAARSMEEALKEVPSVHVVISDLNLISRYDGLGYDLLARVREIYDGVQLPFALISGGSIDGSRACQAQVVGKKPFQMGDMLYLIDSIVPQHLKPQKQA